MQFPISLLVFLLSIAGTIATPTAQPATVNEGAAYERIEFLYYHETNANCSSPTELGIIISGPGKCYTLAHPSKSFNIGGFASEKRLVKGCTLTGYAGTHCHADVNLAIVGPSNNETCYVVDGNMGEQSPIRSVIIEC